MYQDKVTAVINQQGNFYWKLCERSINKAFPYKMFTFYGGDVTHIVQVSRVCAISKDYRGHKCSYHLFFLKVFTIEATDFVFIGDAVVPLIMGCLLVLTCLVLGLYPALEGNPEHTGELLLGNGMGKPMCIAPATHTHTHKTT
jgi:hypothetical protein